MDRAFVHFAAALAAGSLAVTLSAPAVATPAPTLTDYLPEGVTYDPSIPKPRDVLGFEVGEWHVRHDLLAAYMHALAEASPRVRIEETGRTHEARPLLLLTISDPDNLARVEAIRERHLQLTDPAQPMPDLDAMPVVVHLGYSVHGDEATGSNASLAVAYHMAAAQDETTREQLRRAIVLLDPSLNPDGLGRFAGWVNMHKGDVLVADPAHREHNQGWPRGRTNHYWFDLNRDYLPAQHPESRARLTTFHDWRPNVYTDHHEMGTDSTFFFQPGVPSRKHPLTPDENVTLTERIAAYHARALDAQGRLYYTEESFDDFYYGKGSTYPDVHGSIGILFEQASARGHLQDSANGPLSFPFGIKNHATTSFSTLEAAVAMRRDLLDYQGRFSRDAVETAERAATQGIVFGDAGDAARARELIDLLGHHRITVHALDRATEVDGQTFTPGAAWVVPMSQPQARLVQALFERRTSFADATFYDVSTWTLPLAFGLPSASLDSRAMSAAGAPVTGYEAEGGVDPSEQAAAWAFDWDGYYAPRALATLMAAGVRTRVATEPFEGETPDGKRAFDRGTVVVPRGQPAAIDAQRLADLLATVAERDFVHVHAIENGLTVSGIDLGSPSMVPLEGPRIALVVGEGVSMYEAGQAWHLLDHRFGMPVTLLERGRLGGTDLSVYSHLILVDGRWRREPEPVLEGIRAFVEGGGILVAIKQAAQWTQDNLLIDDEGSADDEPEEADGPERRPYAEYSADRAVDLVSGAIFETDLDVTHPLAFGYRTASLPVFVNTTRLLMPEPSAYGNVARYTESPLMSGYASTENIEELATGAVLSARRLGEGLVVRFGFDPNFRAFWYGTNKLFLNALFFGQVIRPTL